LAFKHFHSINSGKTRFNHKIVHNVNVYVDEKLKKDPRLNKINPGLVFGVDQSKKIC
jgi:hypothetical protein